MVRTLFLFLVTLGLSWQVHAQSLGGLRDKLRGKAPAPPATSVTNEARSGGGTSPEPRGTASGGSNASDKSAVPAREAARQPKAATVAKGSVRVTVGMRDSYVPVPKGAQDYNVWSWAPRIEFQLLGPVANGGQIEAEFPDAAGKPWLAFNCGSQPVPAGTFRDVACGMGTAAPEERRSISTGRFPFRIRLKNELQGTAETLFEGSYTVKRYLDDRGNPKHKNHFEYYVDHDANLGAAWVYTDHQYAERPRVVVGMWFRGKIADPSTTAYLFLDGKEVANTQTTDRGVTNTSWDVDVRSNAEGKYKWSLLNFHFFSAVLFNDDKSSTPTHDLDRNPGVYEVKVLREGKLARVVRFTVEPGGKIAEGGLLDKYGLFSAKLRLQAIVPVEIKGEQDLGADLAAWKTGLLYGNPVTELAK
ncbi:MAG: hypothetical protein U0Q16_08620 [Bryobacteraceae bacterium]